MTFQPKNILVPVDFSETGMIALEHASFLARLIKADLILMHVIPHSDYHFEVPERIMHLDYESELSKIVEAKLAEAVEATRINYGINARSITSSGKVAQEILEIANAQRVDLIVMGTHGAKGYDEIFIGSNAHKVVSLANCPVITVQEHSTKLGFTNIVLPIDRSLHSREKVQVAIDLGKVFVGKIHILGLLDQEEENASEKLNLILNNVESLIKKSGVLYDRKVVSGENLAQEALKYGEELKADLIMIMTDHESKLTGVFMGPVAKQIVNHSRIPVMSIKPHWGTFDYTS